MKPKILFVNPRYGGRDGLVILPLDQASAVAYALHRGYAADVVDLAFDPDDSRLEVALQAETYDLIVLTCITICFRTAVDAARVIKRCRPNVPLAIMGEHVTYRREETLLRHPEIDYVISFEAEQTVLELADVVAGTAGSVSLSEIRGITYRARAGGLATVGRTPGIQVNLDRSPIADLDILPPPAKHLYALSRYLERDHETTVITTRGCTHRCSFCHRWRYGRKLRNWSIARVMDEVTQNLEDGYRAIFFQDDVFCYDKSRTETFCNELLARGDEIAWNCNVRVDDFDPCDAEHGRLARLMKEAGCYRIFVGIEAFDQELLDRSRKRAQVELIGRFVRFWQDQGVQVHASYIIGLPGDSEPKIQRRVELALELETDLASFNRIFPHPGTPYGDSPQKWGIVVPDPHWYEKNEWWESAVAGTTELPPDEVYRLQQLALATYTSATMGQGVA